MPNRRDGPRPSIGARDLVHRIVTGVRQDEGEESELRRSFTLGATSVRFVTHRISPT